jgi:hypothetical protein
MIQRRRDYDKREPSRDAHKIYIVCEGKGTEPNYFAFFEGLSSNLQVITIPPADGTDPLKLMERAKQVLIGDDREFTVEYEHGDTVWFVIDTDTWEQEDKIAPLREFCAQKNAAIPLEYDEVKAYSAWNVAQSNPSFEIWLYYHFYENRPIQEEVEKYASFKEYVHNTISGGFNYDKDPARLEDAIMNTKNNFSLDKSISLLIFASEMYRLGTEIDGFVKTDILKLKNKLG